MSDEDSHFPIVRPEPKLLAMKSAMAQRGIRAPCTGKAVCDPSPEGGDRGEQASQMDGAVQRPRGMTVHGSVGRDYRVNCMGRSEGWKGWKAG